MREIRLVRVVVALSLNGTTTLTYVKSGTVPVLVLDYAGAVGRP